MPGRRQQLAALLRKNARLRLRARWALLRDLAVYAAGTIVVLAAILSAHKTVDGGDPSSLRLSSPSYTCWSPCLPGNEVEAVYNTAKAAGRAGQCDATRCISGVYFSAGLQSLTDNSSTTPVQYSVAFSSSTTGTQLFEWLAEGFDWVPDYVRGGSEVDDDWHTLCSTQLLVDQAIAATRLGVPMDDVDLTVSLQQMPYAAWTGTDIENAQQQIVALFVTAVLLLPVQRVVYGVRDETDRQLRGGLESWGLPANVYLASWWLTAVAELLVPALAAWITLVATWASAGPSLELLVVFVLATATYTVTWAVVMRSQAVGSWGALIFWAVLTIPGAIVSVKATATTCYLCMLVPPSAFGLGMRILSSGGDALTMSTQGSEGASVFAAPFSACVWMIVVDMVVAGALLWAGMLAVRRCRRRGCRGCRGAVGKSGPEADDEDLEEPLLLSSSTTRDSPRYVEELAADKVGLETERLCKTYVTPTKTTRALEDLSVRLLTGEITCLLGANGAGKSTTIGLLSGRLEPTSGRVMREGDVGVCPQSDIQWDELTAAEHLELATAAKGASSSSAGLLQRVGLEGRERVVVRELAPNERRLLSVAMALVGGPPVLLLDEPTAGLGLEARRRIWAVLEDLKRDRVILLATQLLDEAELLADRLCVLNAGHLYLHGTLGFAREQFRPQYLVNVPTTDVSVADVVRAKAPAAELGKMTPSYTQFEVPLEARNELPALLRELEQRGWQPQMAVSSLEDAFATMMHELAAYEHEMVERTPSAVEPSTATTTVDTFWGQVRVLMARRTGPGWRAPTTPAGPVGQLVLAGALIAVSVAAYAFFYYTGVLHNHVADEVSWSASSVKGAALLASKGVWTEGGLTLPSLSQWPNTPDPVHDTTSNAAGGVVFTSATEFTIMYDGDSLLSPPALLSLVDSTIVANLSGCDYGSEPLLQASFSGSDTPYSASTYATQVMLEYGAAGVVTILIAVLISDVGATAAYERIVGFKHGLVMAGATRRAYWVSSLLLDSRFFGVLIFAWLLVGLAFVGVAVVVWLAGVSVVAVVAANLELYVLSFGFRTHVGARASLLLFVLGTAALPAIVGLLMVDLAQSHPHPDVNCAVVGVGTSVAPLLSPLFSAGGKLYKLDKDCPWVYGLFAIMPVLGAMVSLLLLRRLEFRTVPHPRRPRGGGGGGGAGSDCVFTVEHVSAQDHLRNVSLQVPAGSCSGVLAPSGGGKSLLLGVLAGDVRCSRGLVHVRGQGRGVGYCPQADPLLDRTTVSEHLLLMARLRRVDVPETAVKTLVAQLGLQEHRDALAMALSGGTRRKVALGMALIGWPRAVVLDDPTRGLDPTARRQAWSLIAAAVARGCAVVVASNSTVEVQALCDHALVLSKDGRVVAQGSLLELQEEHTSGLLASFVVEDEEGGMDPVRAFVRELCPDAVFVDWHRSQLRCKLPGNDMHVADVLEALEGAREELRLVDFTVWQPTLEHVYESVLGL